MNIDKYVGLPYREAARGPDAYDCYGLTALVYQELRGVTLPDFYHEGSGVSKSSAAIAAAAQGEILGGRASRVDDPSDWDIVIIGQNRIPHHVGLVINGGVLHTLNALGSVWHSMPTFSRLFTKSEFYKWHPL